jgi:hypothetical protein
LEHSSIVHWNKKDVLSTDKHGFTQIIEKEELLESLIPASSLPICG